MMPFRLVPPQKPLAEREVLIGVDDLPTFDAVDTVSAHKLLDTAKHVISGGRTLIEFVDLNRDAAREHGVETIAVELAGLIDSGRLDGVKDTLEDSLLKKRSAKVSMEGLTYLRRAERLLSEATRSLNGNPARSFGLGSSRLFSMGGGDTLTFGLVFGAITLGVVAILAVVLISNNGKGQR